MSGPSYHTSSFWWAIFVGLVCVGLAVLWSLDPEARWASDLAICGSFPFVFSAIRNYIACGKCTPENHCGAPHD